MFRNFDIGNLPTNMPLEIYAQMIQHGFSGQLGTSQTALGTSKKAIDT